MCVRVFVGVCACVCMIFMYISMYMKILFAKSIWISYVCAHIKIYEHQKNLCTHGYINISFVHAYANTCEYTYVCMGNVWGKVTVSAYTIWGGYD